MPDPGLLDGDLSADIITLILKLREKTGAVITVTGPKDIVAGEKCLYTIKNGHPTDVKSQRYRVHALCHYRCLCAAVLQTMLLQQLPQRRCSGVAGELAFKQLTVKGGDFYLQVIHHRRGKQHDHGKD